MSSWSQSYHERPLPPLSLTQWKERRQAVEDTFDGIVVVHHSAPHRGAQQPKAELRDQWHRGVVPGLWPHFFRSIMIGARLIFFKESWAVLLPQNISPVVDPFYLSLISTLIIFYYWHDPIFMLDNSNISMWCHQVFGIHRFSSLETDTVWPCSEFQSNSPHDRER